jgi:MYXO-CTERM domain-containing protein
MCDGEDNDCDGKIDEYATGDDVALGLCPPGESCQGGHCDPVDPQEPTPDDGNPADGDGMVRAGCACRAGGGAGPGAGSLLLLAAVVLGLRRRRRDSAGQ